MLRLNDVRKVRLHCRSVQALAPQTLLQKTFCLVIRLVVVEMRTCPGTGFSRLVEEEDQRESAVRLTKKARLLDCERDCWRKG